MKCLETWNRRVAHAARALKRMDLRATGKHLGDWFEFHTFLAELHARLAYKETAAMIRLHRRFRRVHRAFERATFNALSRPPFTA